MEPLFPVHRDQTAEFLHWADGMALPSEHPELARGYRYSAEAFAEVAAAIREHPGVVEVEAIGHTSRGAPIWAFHVVDPGHPPERSVLVLGGIHALEWIGVEVAVDALVDEIRCPEPGVLVTVVPLFNVDGRRDVESDLLAGDDVYRRGNAHHVDLNRDFAVNTEPRAVWRHLIPGYYDHSDHPLSAPESRALDDLAARVVYDRAVSLHSYGGFLYWPWTGRSARPPDVDDFRGLGRAMEAAQNGHSYRSEQLSRWGFFFRAQGTEIDHLYGEYGTRAFLVELTRSGLDPLHPSTFHTFFRWYNPASPERHERDGLRAVQALIRTEPLPGELAHPAGTPRSADRASTDRDGSGP